MNTITITTMDQLQPSFAQINPSEHSLSTLYRMMFNYGSDLQTAQVAQLWLGNSCDCDYVDRTVSALYLGSIETPEISGHINHYWLCRNHDGRLIVCSTHGSSDRSTCAFRLYSGPNGIGGLGCTLEQVGRATVMLEQAA